MSMLRKDTVALAALVVIALSSCASAVRSYAAPAASVRTAQAGDVCQLRHAFKPEPGEPVRARVVELRPLIDANPGAWVIPEAGTRKGVQIQVAQSDLTGCRR